MDKFDLGCNPKIIGVIETSVMMALAEMKKSFKRTVPVMETSFMMALAVMETFVMKAVVRITVIRTLAVIKT